MEGIGTVGMKQEQVLAMIGEREVRLQLQMQQFELLMNEVTQLRARLNACTCGQKPILSVVPE